MAKHSKLYKDSPTTKRDEESGKIKVSKKDDKAPDTEGKEDIGVEGDTAQSDTEKGGLPVEEAHGMDDMNTRHVTEMKDMHKRHEEEAKAMHKRHQKEAHKSEDKKED